MKIHFALYDPSSYNTSENSYWSWKSAEVQKTELESVYFRFLSKNHCEDPNELNESTVWGGAVLLKDWGIVYRFFNGGRDSHGRPGRYLILTGWFARSEEGGIDSKVLTFFRQPPFERLAQSIPPIPVPEFPALSECWNSYEPLGTVAPIARRSLGDVPFQYPAGVTAEKALGEFFGMKPCEDGLHLTLQIDTQGTKAVLLPTPKKKEQKFSSGPFSGSSLDEIFRKKEIPKSVRGLGDVVLRFVRNPAILRLVCVAGILGVLVCFKIWMGKPDFSSNELTSGIQLPVEEETAGKETKEAGDGKPTDSLLAQGVKESSGKLLPQATEKTDSADGGIQTPAGVEAGNGKSVDSLPAQGVKESSGKPVPQATGKTDSADGGIQPPAKKETARKETTEAGDGKSADSLPAQGVKESSGKPVPQATGKTDSADGGIQLPVEKETAGKETAEVGDGKSVDSLPAQGVKESSGKPVPQATGKTDSADGGIQLPAGVEAGGGKSVDSLPVQGVKESFGEPVSQETGSVLEAGQMSEL